MSTIRKSWSFWLLLISLLLLIACAEAEPTAVPEEPTAAPAEVEPTEQAIEEPTAVPEEEAPTPLAEEEPGDDSYPAPQANNTLDSYPAPQANNALDSYPAPEDANIEEETATFARLFVISPDESTASYVVAETFFEAAQDQLGIAAGLVDTIGSTSAIDGQISLILGETVTLDTGSVFEVNISTLTSDQSRRDSTIQDRFLESAAFPIATFHPHRHRKLPQPIQCRQRSHLPTCGRFDNSRNNPARNL